MYIKKIQLKNFQAHSDFELEFNSDVNIITGKSEAGKSCIRRAIEWILFNANISEQSYRREGTKQTSVKIWLDNGFEIERIRSNSLNRYILSHNDFEDKTFDSFGKTIPEEIQEAIEVSEIEIDNERLNLNVSEQIKLPFLLDKPASFRSKLFNKLTGNEVLDKLFKEMNKENLRFNREIKNTEEILEKQEEQLSEYSQQYKKLKKKLKLVKTKYQDILKNIEIYENLKELSDNLITNSDNQENIQKKMSQIKIISDKKLKDLKNKAEKFKNIQALSYELESMNENIESVKKKKQTVKSVDFDEKKLVKNTETLQKLKRLNEQSLHNIELSQALTVNKKIMKERLTNTKAELEQVWKDCPQCPLCKQEIKK